MIKLTINCKHYRYIMMVMSDYDNMI